MIAKLGIFAGGQYATLEARMLPLAKMLETFGIESYVITPFDWCKILKGKLGRVLSAVVTYGLKDHLSNLHKNPNVVIIGRTSNLEAYLLTKIIKRKKIRVIFDLDDALFLPVGSILGVKVRPGSYYLEMMLKNADYVTTNGRYLLSYVRKFNANSTIIHDPVDTNLFHPRNKVKNHDKIVISWEGGAPVHHENLAILLKPLKKIANTYERKVKFKIVSYLGDRFIKNMFGSLERFIEVDYGSERWLSTKQFATLLYDSDIMVSPLKEDQWYEGKSALRVGIGMAMGIPVVASPVGEQKYVIKHGVNGFLAKNEDEWYTYLKMLIEDENLRKKFGKEGRSTAENHLSLEVNGRKLYKIIEHILESCSK